MCRELNHPNHRRCPSSQGENRNGRDRAKYAANKAAGKSSPVDTGKTAAPDVLIPVSLEDAASQVRERVHNRYARMVGKNLGHATYDRDDESTHNLGRETWAELEEDVRSVGQAVETRASEIAGFTAEEAAERQAARCQRVKDEIEPLNERIKANSARLQQLNLELNSPDGDDSGLRAEWDAIRSSQDELKDEALRVGAAIAADCGLGDVDDHNVNSALRKIQQGHDPLTLADTKTLADARLSALSEIRDMGGVAIELNDNSSKRVSGIMEEVAEHYPADWIRLSNDEGNLKVKDTKGRAHYSQKRTQKVRQQVTELRWRGPDEEPEGEGWVRGVWTGSGWSNPIDNPDAAERYADYAGSEHTSERVAWYRPAYKTRKAYRYFDGEDVQGNPPRGWEEAYETLSDGRKYRVFRQPAWRMGHGESVAELTVDKDRPGAQWQDTKGFGTALHETAHRMEHVNPAIFQLEEEFLRRRTTDADGNRDRLENLYLSNRERGRPDSFANKYMGKEYNDNYREVMSTGMEALFAGGFGSLAGIDGQTPDADMRAFILGVLATA